MDREKVISTFEKIISVCKEDGCDFVDLSFEDADQILALLKEQEAAYQGAVELLRQKTILFDDAIKRLKEQEAVEPFSDDDGAYWCGSCHEDLVRHQKFCSNCGKPVLWEGR